MPDFSHTFWGVLPPPLSALPYRPRLHLPVRFLCSALSAPDVPRWVSCTPPCTGRPRLHLPVRFLCSALSAPDVTRWVSWTPPCTGRPRLHLPVRFLSTALSAPDVTRWVSCTPPCTGRPRLHLPVRFLSTALSAPDVSRWVSCVTVSDLCRVSLSAQCSLCGHQLAAGCCTFVGCHGRGRHNIIARARSVMGNVGTASVRAATVQAGRGRPSEGQCVSVLYRFISQLHETCPIFSRLSCVPWWFGAVFGVSRRLLISTSSGGAILSAS